MKALRPGKSYDHYYRFAEIEETLHDYAERYPDYCRLTSLVKTEQGRDMWMLSITNTATGGFEDKPGYCTVGCIHSAEVCGMMSVMFFADHLLTNRLDDEATRKLLDTYTVYCIPCASPDGMEFFYANGCVRSGLTPYPPVDVLPDGIYPEDVDGDGAIRIMRIKDPNGLFKKSKLDDRLMVRRDYDEVEGEFYSCYTEGRVKGSSRLKDLRDADPWDDPLGRFRNDFNRDFPGTWAPPSKQKGAGEYPLHNPETKALADLLLDYRNIGAFASYHVDGGVFLYPPSGCSPDQCDRGDLRRYKLIGEIATEETGYENCNINEIFGNSHGGIDDYVYGVRGVFCCSIEAWDTQIRAGVTPKWKMKENMAKTPTDHEMDEYKMLQWVDREFPEGRYKRWEAFNHPDLGEVEIGGYDWRWDMFNPPIKFLYQEVEKLSRFMFRHVCCLPKIDIDEVSVNKRRDGLYDIEAVVINRRFLPTNVTQEAVKLGEVKPDVVSLQGAECLGSSAVQAIGFLAGSSVSMAMPAHGKWRNFGHEKMYKTVRWTVAAEPGTKITITAKSQRAGRAEAVVELK